MKYPATFFIYIVFVFFSTLLAYFGQKANNKILRFFFLVCTYLLVVLFWSLRKGIGFDYDNYIMIYYEIKNGYDSYVEPAYHIFTKICSFDKGEYCVIALYAIFTYLMLFVLFIKKNILWLGVLFSFAFQFQFMATNQMRQALAISIFLLVLPLIEKGRWLISYLLIGLAALTCHTSALFLFFLIPFSNIKISGKKWSLIIIILYLMYLKGMFVAFGNLLLTAFPLPENYQHFLLSSHMESEHVGFSLVMLFNVLVALYVAWNNNFQEKRIFTLYMIGICMYIVFIEYHLLLRLSFYLFYANIYVVSMFCKEEKQKGYLLLFATFFFTLLICAQSTNMHGVIPYKTIL